MWEIIGWKLEFGSWEFRDSRTCLLVISEDNLPTLHTVIPSEARRFASPIDVESPHRIFMRLGGDSVNKYAHLRKVAI